MKNLPILGIVFLISLIFIIPFVSAGTIVQDDFVRSDRALNGDTATNGNAWSCLGSTAPAIVSNEAYLIDTGVDAECELELSFEINATNEADYNITFRTNVTAWRSYYVLKSGSTSKAQIYTDISKIYGYDDDTPAWVELGAFAADTWHNVSYVNFDFSADTFDILIDSTLYNNGGAHFGFENDATNSVDTVRLDTYGGGTFYTDEINFVNDSEVGTSSFLITAVDDNNGSSISVFDANITGDSTYNTSTGTITTNLLQNSTSLWNITVWNATGYENRIYLNTNISSDLEASLFPTWVPILEQASINCTSCYGNKTTWQGNVNNSATTQDRDPTIVFNTDNRGNWSISTFAGNFSAMIDNDANSLCSGTVNTTNISCTLPSTKSLTDGNDFLYLAARSAYGYEDSNYSVRLNITQDFEFIGNVTDADGNAIADATVVIMYQSNNTVYNVSTSNGTGYVNSVFFRNPLENFTIHAYNLANTSQGGDIDVFVDGS